MIHMKNKLKKYFVVFSGYCLAMGLSLVCCFTFYAAYFHGGIVRVSVNHYGEADMEFILIPMVMFFVFVGLFFSWRNLRDETKNR